ncbi:MAG TPA: hypothetical protein VI669_11385 [Vicinamibacteria bacterium]
MTCFAPETLVVLQCAWCGQVRVEGGVYTRSDGEGLLEEDRSHGICPTCLRRELKALEESGIID